MLPAVWARAAACGAAPGPVTASDDRYVPASSPPRADAEAGGGRDQPAQRESMTNHLGRPTRRPRRAWPATARTAVSVITVVALALLAGACGGNPSSTGPGGSSNARGPASAQSPSSQTLDFARCMRSNGVPSFPDPNSSGELPKESPPQLGVSNSKFQSTVDACQHLLPNGGNGPNQAQLEQARAQALSYAQCMHEHGVALPDPDSSGRIPDPATVGINQGSPQFEAANQACGKYRPPYMPSNAEYNAYAQAQGS
jgi:hypothetical protein